MLYPLYVRLVESLVDNGWRRTLSLLRFAGFPNPTYVALDHGSLKTRIKRFKALQSLGHDTEDDKLSFLRALFVPEQSSGRTALCDYMRHVIDSPQDVRDLFVCFSEMNLFKGAKADECRGYFFKALFAKNDKGESAFSSALDKVNTPTQASVLKELFKQARLLGLFDELNTPFFLSELRDKQYYLIRKATLHFSVFTCLAEEILLHYFPPQELSHALNLVILDVIMGNIFTVSPFMRVYCHAILTASKLPNELINQMRFYGAQLTEPQVRYIERFFATYSTITKITMKELKDSITCTRPSLGPLFPIDEESGSTECRIDIGTDSLLETPQAEHILKGLG